VYHGAGKGLIAVAIALIACGTGNPQGDAVPPAPSNLDSLRHTILSLVAEPSCKDVGECRALPFGAKPCGGPWSYLVFSTQVTDSTELARVVRQYGEREAELNRELGRVSDCQMVAPAKLECVAGRCEAVR
jgi:hypothetical protein